MRRFDHLLYSILILTLLFITVKPVSAQEEEQKGRIIDPSSFNPGYFASCIIKEMNKYRISQGNEALVSNKVLEKAADDQAYYMAEKEEKTKKNKWAIRTTAKRVMKYGGTNRVQELINKENVRRGRDYYSYEYVAKEIVDGWVSRRKYEPIVNNPKFIFAGVGGVIDAEGKKIYVSVVLGNHKSFNTGAKKRDYMRVPYTTKQYRLKTYDKRTCRKCDRFEDLSSLHDALYVKDGLIYFQYDEDYRAFRRLLRKKHNGLAVEVVQKEQYSCEHDDNIVDYNLVNKGVMLKPMFTKKLYKKNMVKGRRVREMHVVLGEFPEEIKGNYELNLLLIQERHVCKIITKTYIESGTSDFFHPLELVPDTVSIESNTVYVPVPDTTRLTFRIPFEQGKFEYETHDIEPILKALNEPDFFIIEAEIIAVSSLEGTEEINKKLQVKRAESIVKAMESRQKNDIISNVSTNDSWDLFRAEIKDTKYSKMFDMTKDEAREYIRKKNLIDELEPILAKHRFAQVDLRVVYDIAGEKEGYFVVDQYNKAIKREDIPFAFAIQKFIIDKVVMKVYNPEVLDKMLVPENESLAAPLVINKLFLEKISTKNKLEPEFCEKINQLYDQAPDNPYIFFNKTCCDVRNKEIVQDQDIREMQYTINEFYNTDIPKEYVDNLNLNFQFRTVKLTDTLEQEISSTAEDAFERIKEIIDIDETTMASCYELAKLFIKYKDYEFAGKLLDKFIDDPDVGKEYVFTYISVCSHSQARIMSNSFARALEKASRMDKIRYCKLFEGDKFSFQVFDNPFVKETYCKTCYR